MTAPSSRTARRPVSAVPGDPAPDPGVIGIGLAAVLTFALAQGSWQWFATFIGVTFLAVMSVFERRARWSPGLRSPYPRALVAYALVVRLCVRSPWPRCRNGTTGRSPCARLAATANCSAGSRRWWCRPRWGTWPGRTRPPWRSRGGSSPARPSPTASRHDDSVAAALRDGRGGAGGDAPLVPRPRPCPLTDAVGRRRVGPRAVGAGVRDRVGVRDRAGAPGRALLPPSAPVRVEAARSRPRHAVRTAEPHRGQAAAALAVGDRADQLAQGRAVQPLQRDRQLGPDRPGP